MKGIVKVQIQHSNGRKEKLGLEVISGDKVPLTSATIGVETGCHLDITENTVRIVANKGAPDFRFADSVGREFEVKPGNTWQDGGCTIEFLSLPQPMPATSVEATRYVKFSKSDLQGQSPSCPPQVADTADATSMILKMPVPPSTYQLRMQVVGAPDPKRVDLDERLAKFIGSLISLGIIGIGAEASTAVLGWLSHGRFRLAPGLGFLAMTAFSASIAIILHVLKDRTRWHSEPFQLFRKGAYASVAASVLIATGVAGLAIMSGTPSSAPVLPAPVLPAPAAPIAKATQPEAAPVQQMIPAQQLQPAIPPPLPPNPAPVAAAAPSEIEPDMAKEEFFSAIRSHDLGLVKRLVEKRSVDVNFTLNRGFSALHRATIKGDLPMVKYLVSKRANLNAKDPNGNTPVMWATFKRKKTIVAFLVKKGADLNIRREDGFRALDIAKRYGLNSYTGLLTPKEKSRSIASKHSKSKIKAKPKAHSKPKSSKSSRVRKAASTKRPKSGAGRSDALSNPPSR